MSFPPPLWCYILASSPASCSLKLGFGWNSTVLPSHLNDFFFIESLMIILCHCEMVLMFNLLINTYMYKLGFGWNLVILSSYLNDFLFIQSSTISSSQCEMVLIFNLSINSYIYKLGSSQLFLLGANANMVSSLIYWLIHSYVCVYIHICVTMYVYYVCT